MILNFDKIEKVKLEKMRNGEGYVYMQKYDDGRKMIAQITIPPQASIGFHTHVNDDEVVYVLKGQGKCLMGKETCMLKAGDVNYTSKEESHSIINDSSEDLVILAIISK